MNNRLEIFRDGVWWELRLRDKDTIKYNKVINRIGNTDSRQISHTNTFSLPSVSQNLKAFGVNFFNPSVLAKAFNSKFEANYFVEDKLLQKGFLVINNTQNGQINVNFFDESLGLTELWGKYSFKELLKNKNLSIPIDYVSAISEASGYQLNKTEIALPTSEVGVRGYKMIEFPNNLNSIGDLFQKNSNDERVDNYFNPYQSRPIFNVKSLFDLACETFGYSTTFDGSVDWSNVEKTFFIEKGMLEGEEKNNVLVKSNIDIDVTSTQYYTLDNGATGWEAATVVEYPSETYSTTPSQIPNWDYPDSGWISGGVSYEARQCVYIPDTIESFLGELHWVIDVVTTPETYLSNLIEVYAIWENLTPTNGVLFSNIKSIGTDSSTNLKIDFLVNKADILTNKPVAASDKFFGIIIRRRIFEASESPTLTFTNQTLSEESVPSNIIAYDEFGQYISKNIDLTHAAPDTTIKNLLSAYMQKEGILLQIDSKLKNVKFFTYGHYQSQKISGNYYDWSKYLRKYDLPLYNTDYGNNYAKINKIGLSSPYTGNTFLLELENQGADSRYKDNISNYVKDLKDISKILYIENTLTPYFEFENLGLGLVEKTSDLGTLTQARADGSVQGNFSGLTAVQNVNYSTLPKGVVEWYRLVDKAVRAEANFIIPTSEMRELDLSKPVFIEGLGGFFIIEEISEYINAQTTVSIKLIKLIDGLQVI